jgi:dihydrofolate reductase
MRLSLIVAMSENGVIGREGELPWRLSADLQRFKKLTMGHHIVMGRKTFNSIGRILPGRTSVVLTRQAGWTAEGAVTANSLDEALRIAKDDDEVFIIGGAQLYDQALPHVDRLYLTLVNATVSGDTTFSEFEPGDWKVIEKTEHPSDERNEHPHTFMILDRVSEKLVS